MVRRNELACRDEWSRSLWQPVSGELIDSEPKFSRPPTTGPLPAATPEHLRALLSRDETTAATAGEDVLLSEGRIVSEEHHPWQPPARPAPTVNFDTRTAIFRAREAYRERARAKAAADRLSGGAEALSEGPSRDAMALPDAPDVREPEHRAVSSQEPAVEGAPVAASRIMQAEPSMSVMNVELNVNGAAISEPLIAPPPDADARASRRVGSDVAAMMPPSATESTPVVQSTGSLEPSTPEIGPPRPETPLDLPEWYRTDLPRICRACRDFRPSADGQRGWCANQWAFTHRRLVQEDDFAPCQSAIGDWWVPVDDTWLVAADVSAHGRATPLVDRLVGREAPRRRRS
jgi:hypothetical protein